MQCLIKNMDDLHFESGLTKNAKTKKRFHVFCSAKKSPSMFFAPQKNHHPCFLRRLYWFFFTTESFLMELSFLNAWTAVFFFRSYFLSSIFLSSIFLKTCFLRTCFLRTCFLRSRFLGLHWFALKMQIIRFLKKKNAFKKNHCWFF